MAEHLANEREMICLEPVGRTFQRVKPHLPTLSPSQYNHYKSPNQPTAGAIVRKTGKSWSQILESIGLPLPLDRDTLSRLSQSLHLLEKKLVRALGIGWQETAFLVAGHHKLRPDSFYLERAYLQSRQLLILDVKLSACSAPLTIYKYLPIFEDPPIPSQATFFPTWIPEEKEKAEPGIRIDERGQIGLFAENNVLYICYLMGVPPKDLLPGSKISCGRVSALKKTLPGACVDGILLNQIFGPGASIQTDRSQRKKYRCGCTLAVDVGRYIEKGALSHRCPHQCLQCYARP